MNFVPQDQNGNRRWIIEKVDPDYLLTTLPTANRSAKDNRLFTLRNAICCLRHRFPFRYDMKPLTCIQDALDDLQQYEPQYLASWIAARPTSSRHKAVDKMFRDDYKGLEKIRTTQLKRREVTRTDARLAGVENFPADALDHLCIGIKKELAPANIAKGLEQLFPQKGDGNFPKRPKPFTEENVDALFEYLRITEWRMYDKLFLGPETTESKEKLDKLKASIEEAKASPSTEMQQ
ncbi:MAG: hypothetical protein Q9166_004966 [cf. Caloplaca sp. 2 TL-2023]